MSRICWIAAPAVALALLTACNDHAAPHKAARGADAARAAASQYPFSKNVLVDQFGYAPEDPKVAVIRSPEVGYDAHDGYRAADFYDVRQAADGRIVYSGVPTPWKNGEVEASSGDRGWWFDFSSVTAPGEYFVLDPKRGVRSATFKVGPHVYRDVLKAAVRMYFYQRSGYRKEAPYADECWQDDAAYAGKNQDGEAHDVTDQNNPAKVRDLSGGWFDAGDTNKYVTYAVPAVHQLLTAYSEHPQVFTDDFNIPESGNGVPDVLDEVKWEIDWLKKMQFADGSAALKVGDIKYRRASPPSSDSSPRYYVPGCTSATIAVAGMFAHAAYVFSQLPSLAPEVPELRARAGAAWRNFHDKAPEEHCDAGIVLAGNADWNAQDQNAEKVVAAIYLFALTDDDRYGEYLKQHYRESRPYRDVGWSRYNAEQGDALMFYTTLPNADPATRNEILENRRSDVQTAKGVYGFDADSDLYRAYMHDEQYHWGSNQIRANYGNSNLDLGVYPLGFADVSNYRLRALETLHYFHGVNPFGMVYLTNMYSHGATSSVNEILHAWYAPYSNRFSAKLDRIPLLNKAHWFDFKSKWDDAMISACGPAPGFVPGGPNRGAEANGVPRRLSPPTGQPPQKSYKDWNVAGEDAAWAINEPGIYYQAAYVKLLSAFAN
jgi:endoglucanase